MCSGRVDLSFVLRAFSKGIDGVFIGGCHLNECNYITHGNYQALNMVLLCKRIMEYIGLNPERLRIQFMSGAEANIFVESSNDFIKKVKRLGPIGKAEGLDENALQSKLAEITKLVPYIKVVKNEKLGTRLENPAEYDSFFTKEEIDKLFGEMFSYYIDPEKCQACTTCFRRCPVGAIISAKGEVHIIDQDKCIRCGSCIQACPPRFGAITKITDGPVPPPLPEGQRAIVKKTKEKEVA
jgi:F420-non-reducing hydrogenase iron-sulfur subunit